MKQYTVLTAWILLWSSDIFAQSPQPWGNGFELRFAYFGRLFTHPGLALSIVAPVISSNQEFSGVMPVIPTHQALAGVTIGYYFHEGNHHALFARLDAGYRLILPDGWFTQAMGSIGIQRTVLDGTTYSIDAAGKPIPIPFAGSVYMMPSALVGVGKRFGDSTSFVRDVYANIGTFWQYPFNTQFLLNPVLEIGATVPLQGKTP